MRKRVFVLGFTAGVAVALVLFLNLGHSSRTTTAQEKLPSSQELGVLKSQLEGFSNTSEAFVKTAKLIRPSVVHLIVSTTVEARDPWEGFFDDDPFFHRFFDDRRVPKRFQQRSQGTGFIVDSRGYVLTNHHVVRNADQIIVRLMDDREFSGKLVGTDPVTDLAVVKIDAAELPPATIGDSDKLEVGEWVVAVGNPFGLQSTVTLGIVSAKGRSHLGIVEQEDYIQTDAAINPGNSGGPLVNARGQVVGVNSAIYSRSGGYQGIGFAIPMNLARRVYEDLVSHGKVRRGTLGVKISDLDPRVAQQHQEHLRGAVIAEVLGSSPATRAGMKPGDIIFSFAGQTVRDGRHLRSLILQQTVGSKVAIEVLRNGQKLNIHVAIEEWTPEGP